MNLKVFLLSAFLLVGCTFYSNQQSLIKLPPGWHSYQNNAYSYIIGVPDSAFIPNKSDTKDQIFFGSISQLEKNTGHEFDIYLYSGSKVASCSPLLTGASMSVPLVTANGQTSWGRVDYYDNGANMYNPNPDPLCRPPSLNTLTPDLVEKFVATRAAYVLCSEKDGKAVIVCISQMTKDESFAKQIFETFRWTQ